MTQQTFINITSAWWIPLTLRLRQSDVINARRKVSYGQGKSCFCVHLTMLKILYRKREYASSLLFNINPQYEASSPSQIRAAESFVTRRMKACERGFGEAKTTDMLIKDAWSLRWKPQSGQVFFFLLCIRQTKKLSASIPYANTRHGPSTYALAQSLPNGTPSPPGKHFVSCFLPALNYTCRSSWWNLWQTNLRCIRGAGSTAGVATGMSFWRKDWRGSGVNPYPQPFAKISKDIKSFHPGQGSKNARDECDDLARNIRTTRRLPQSWAYTAGESSWTTATKLASLLSIVAEQSMLQHAPLMTVFWEWRQP